jgi:hypothetical protein
MKKTYDNLRSKSSSKDPKKEQFVIVKKLKQ